MQKTNDPPVSQSKKLIRGFQRAQTSDRGASRANLAVAEDEGMADRVPGAAAAEDADSREVVELGTPAPLTVLSIDLISRLPVSVLRQMISGGAVESEKQFGL